MECRFPEGVLEGHCSARRLRKFRLREERGTGRGLNMPRKNDRYRAKVTSPSNRVATLLQPIRADLRSLLRTRRRWKKDRPDRDRRVRQADRLARILRVLELVQSRGRWTTRAIAEEIECSERTVYRDLDVLRFAGIPYYREGDQQFVRVRPDFRFPVMSLCHWALQNQPLMGASKPA